MTPTTLILLLILNLTIIAYVGYQTYMADFEKRHRWMIYICLLVSPVFGALLFLIYQRTYRKKMERELFRKD